MPQIADDELKNVSLLGGRSKNKSHRVANSQYNVAE